MLASLTSWKQLPMLACLPNKKVKLIWLPESQMQEMSLSIGDGSARAEINDQGIGSMLAFYKEDRFVSSHTAQAADQRPLLPLDDLEKPARKV